MKNIILCFFVGMFIISCKNNQSTNQEASANSNTEPVSSVSTVSSGDHPTFQIDSAKDSLGQAVSLISLNMNGKNFEVTKAGVICEPIGKDSYKYYLIPPGAVAACGGMGAAKGEFYFLMKNPNSDYYMVMFTEVDDQKDATQYNYQSIMNITHQTK